MTGIVAQNLESANSTIRLTGVTGYFNNADAEMTSVGTLELVDDGATPAFIVNNGYSENGKTIFAALKGDGTFKSGTVKAKQRYVFKDVSDFTGTIDISSGMMTRVILGDGASLLPVPANGTITVVSGAEATIAAGKTWTAQAGITVNGTLKVGQSGEAVVQGGGLTLADGATLAFNFTDHKTAPVLNLANTSVTLGSQNPVRVVLSGTHPDFGNGGKWVLTTGGKFAGKSIDTSVTQPKWVESVGIDDDGNIYVQVIQKGMVISVS